MNVRTHTAAWWYNYGQREGKVEVQGAGGVVAASESSGDLAYRGSARRSKVIPAIRPESVSIAPALPDRSPQGIDRACS